MATASGPPPKPWERAGSSSGPAPFKPPSTGTTSDVVESSGTSKPGEIVSTSPRNAGVNSNAVGRPLPTRPWENNNIGSNSYGGAAGYNSGLNYNSGVGSGMYNSYGSGYGGTNGGMYGNSMYRGGYGGTGGGLYSSGMYGGGGGMYSGGLGGAMGGGYGMGGMGMGGMGMGGMGGMGGPYGPQDPNNPPPSPPGFWISFLRVMEGFVTFFGRISFLVDQNTQAIHFFMSALLQLFDRGGTLYGELARFVLRILGRRRSKSILPPGPNGLPLPGQEMQQRYLEGPKPGPGGNWDNVWGNDPTR